jgi:hypothetical protein
MYGRGRPFFDAFDHSFVSIQDGANEIRQVTKSLYCQWVSPVPFRGLEGVR